MLNIFIRKINFYYNAACTLYFLKETSVSFNICSKLIRAEVKNIFFSVGGFYNFHQILWYPLLIINTLVLKYLIKT